ncbi:MAG: tRNA pseudouridine(38-40) synthase TruA [Synergistaceae bacterium]|jgi:tRNA pseudouridine38-40 synthase|nr:tRNA pseudouridine(38-40) synthase TruA [Synergistaceae bacterium]
MKYAAVVAYTGTGYSGWQRQKEAIGVQQVLEEALGKLSSRPVQTVAAGRTDAGVHSVGQVASFSMDREWEPSRLVLAVNAHLPDDVRVSRVMHVPDGFDARRDALWREYRYFLFHGPYCPPQLRGFVWWRKAPWDAAAAREMCRMFEGEHDFRAFCKTGECPDNSRRTVLRARYKKIGGLSIIAVRAKSFLMNMVRIMVGSIDVASRNGSTCGGTESLRRLLDGAERSEAGATAPACGLFFWCAGYDVLTDRARGA